MDRIDHLPSVLQAAEWASTQSVFHEPLPGKLLWERDRAPPVPLSGTIPPSSHKPLTKILSQHGYMVGRVGGVFRQQLLPATPARSFSPRHLPAITASNLCRPLPPATSASGICQLTLPATYADNSASDFCHGNLRATTASNLCPRTTRGCEAGRSYEPPAPATPRAPGRDSAFAKLLQQMRAPPGAAKQGALSRHSPCSTPSPWPRQCLRKASAPDIRTTQGREARRSFEPPAPAAPRATCLQQDRGKIDLAATSAGVC